MKCPTCNKRNAIMDSRYGLTSCQDCQKKTYKKIRNPELTTESIKEQRVRHADSIIQPFREGKLSKEYLDKYGSKYIDVDQREIERAQNVWIEDSYYRKP